MNVLFVVAHPEPRSFNGTLAEVGRSHFRELGDSVEVSDLYAEGFDPVEKPRNYARRVDAGVFAPLAEQRAAWKEERLCPEVLREIRRLECADLVVFQFPVWWHSVPAILKGWFDRVFVSGGLYNSRMRYDAGYFRGKRALCSVTSGAPEGSFVPGGRGGELGQILWSTHYSLHYMGFSVMQPHATFGVQGHGYAYTDDEAFGRHLETAKQSLRDRLAGLDRESPMIFPGWDDWDDPLQHHEDKERATQC